MQVLHSSVSFALNDLTIHPDGNMFDCSGSYQILVDDEYVSIPMIYRFTRDDSWEDGWAITEITPRPSNIYPSQILPNGIMVAAKGQRSGPETYLLMPDSDTFISIQDYYAATHPGWLAWMNENLNASGLVSIDNDMTVFAGGCLFYQLNDYNEDIYYTSYIYIDEEGAGVAENLVENNDGIYTVYNLQGVKVLQTEDAAAVNALPKGIYIVNGKKIAI